MVLASKKPQIFLSHSGLDKRRAIKFGAQLKREVLTRLGDRVEVFNTSEPEYRFKDLQEILRPSEHWRARAKKYERELRSYLSKNLRESFAFVALVTPNSLRAASELIEFEIETARSAAAKDRMRFFPCVADGANLSNLPSGAIEFEGIALGEKDGLARLVAAMGRVLSKHTGVAKPLGAVQRAAATDGASRRR